MKKLLHALILIVMLFSLSGCFAGCSEDGCFETVKSSYPNSIVIKVGRSYWKFIVLTQDDTLLYVEVGNIFDTKITKKEILFHGVTINDRTFYERHYAK